MERVVVREAQSGFVGTTGTVIVIEPDGQFTEARFVNEVTAEPHRRGLLSQASMMQLAESVQRADFGTLPARAGGAPVPNPYEVRVSVGARTVTAVAPPGLVGRSDLTTAGVDPQLVRVLELARAVRTLLGDGAGAAGPAPGATTPPR